MGSRQFATGDILRIRPIGGADWTRARVILASRNGESIAVEIYDVLRDGRGGLYTGGAVPLSIDYEAETVTDLMGNRYEIEISGATESPTIH